MRKLFIAVLIVATFFSACKKDDPVQKRFELTEGVFIVNQGAFNADNASLFYFDPVNNQQHDSLFYSINSASLGDVAQSINVQSDVSYIVINNSGLIYCIDNKYAEIQGKITGLTSPRNILMINSEKAYVSDLYNSNLSVVNPTTYEITGEIALNRTSEEMILIGTKAYVANFSAWSQTLKNDVIMIIDTDADHMTDTIKVGIEPNSMVLDKDDNIWVLCSGGFTNEENPTLWKISGATGEILKTYTFEVQESNPLALKINGEKDQLFFLNNGVFKMAVDADQLPANAFIEQGNAFFGYLGIDPQSGDIYIGDPKDYQSIGNVYHYSKEGILITEFETGIIPAAFGFNY